MLVFILSTGGSLDALFSLTDQRMLPVMSDFLHVVKGVEQKVISPLIPVNGHGAIPVHADMEANRPPLYINTQQHYLHPMCSAGLHMTQFTLTPSSPYSDFTMEANVRRKIKFLLFDVVYHLYFISHCWSWNYTLHVTKRTDVELGSENVD